MARLSPITTIARCILALAVAIVSGTTLGCPDKQPILDDHHRLRLRGFRGENVEDELVRKIDARDDEARQKYHIESLGLLGTAKSLTLLELIDERRRSEKLAAAAREAIDRINARNGQAPDLAKARQSYFESLQERARTVTLEPFERMMALKELAWFGAETADRLAASLAEWFADPKADLKYRRTAILMAYSIPTPAALDALCGFTGDETWYIDEVPFIYEFARQQFPDRYLNVWKAGFENAKRPNLNEGAAFLLGYAGDPSVISYFEQRLADPDKERRERSLAFLKNIKDPRVKEIAVGLLRDSTDKTILRHALDALDTNYEPAKTEGEPSEYFTLVRDNWRHLPTENRRQALTVLVKHEEFGGRDLYFEQVKSAEDAEVRQLAAQLRVGDPKQKDAARDMELIARLAEENDDKTVGFLVGGFANMYEDEWEGNAAVCDALVAVAKRADGRAWAWARAEVLKVLGMWGRIEDAVAIEAMVNYEEFSEIHGTFAAAGSKGFRDLSPNGSAFPPVPEFAAVEAILSRHDDEFVKRVRGYSASQSATERALVLHYFYLAGDGDAQQAWRKATGADPKVAAVDMKFFQPFALSESNWKDMFRLLADTLKANDPTVANAAFTVLVGRFLVRQLDGTYRNGVNLAGVFADENQKRFIKDLMPVMAQIVKSGDPKKLEFITRFIAQGALPPTEVATLTKELLGSGNATESMLVTFLDQLAQNMSPNTFVDTIVPVVDKILETPWKNVHRRVAQLVKSNFNPNIQITNELTSLIRELVVYDDQEIRAIGQRAAEDMGRWAAQRPRNTEQIRRRDRLRDAVAILLKEWSSSSDRNVRRVASRLIDQLAPVAATPSERTTNFFRSVESTVNSMSTNTRDQDDELVMRPVSRFLGAMGDRSDMQNSLVSLLGNPDADVRLNAIEGLFKRIVPTLIPDLKKWVQNESNENVRARGLELYAECGVKGREIEPAIWLEADFRGSRDSDLPFAEKILASWIAATRSASDRERIFLQLCDEKGEDVYALLLPPMRYVASKNGLPLLKKIVERSRPPFRALAAGVLARIPDSNEAEDLLGKLINDDEKSVRMAAIAAAGEVGRLSAMATLMMREQKENLEADEAQAIRTAIAAIVKFLNENMTPIEQVQRLVQLIDEATNDSQRVFFIDELAKVDHPQRTTVLEQKMTSSNDAVRRAAVKAYISVRGEQALDRLQPIVTDRSEAVRTVLVEYLGTLTGPKVNEMLEKFLKDSELSIRLKALNARGRDKTESRLLAVLEDVIRGDDKTEMRVVAARLLKDVRVPGVYEVLIEAAKDGNVQVREESMKSLVALWDDPGSLTPDEGALRRIALERLADEPPVQLHTLELVKRLGNQEFVEKLKDLQSRTSDQSVRMKIIEVLRALTGE